MSKTSSSVTPEYPLTREVAATVVFKLPSTFKRVPSLPNLRGTGSEDKNASAIDALNFLIS